MSIPPIIARGLSVAALAILALLAAAGHTTLAAYVDRSAAEIDALVTQLLTENQSSSAHQTALQLTHVARMQGLPDSATRRLIAFLDDDRESEARTVIRPLLPEVLAYTGRSSAAIGEVIDALARCLDRATERFLRQAAIDVLSRISRRTPLPQQVRATVETLALDEPDWRVRERAVELSTRLGMPAETKVTLSDDLVALSLKSPEELTGSRDRVHDAIEIKKSIIALLAALHAPTYPANVLESWARLAGEWLLLNQPALDALAAAKATTELPPSVLTILGEQAARYDERDARHTRATYAVLLTSEEAAKLDTQAVEDFEREFTGDAPARDRRAAGYFLIQVAGTRHPAAAGTVDGAIGTLESNSEPELRRIAAELILLAVPQEELSAEEAYRHIAKVPLDNGLADLVIARYAESGDLTPPLRLFAGDPAKAADLRLHVIERFRESAVAAGGTPSDEAQALLTRIAWRDPEHRVRQSAGGALRELGLPVPLRIPLENHANQSKALFWLWCGLLATYPVSGIWAFVALLVRRPAPGRGWRRALAVALWLVCSSAVLAAFALGLLGFLGHNKSPLPRETLMVNLPLYVLMSLYVTGTWRIVRRPEKATSRG